MKKPQSAKIPIRLTVVASDTKTYAIRLRLDLKASEEPNSRLRKKGSLAPMIDSRAHSGRRMRKVTVTLGTEIPTRAANSDMPNATWVAAIMAGRPQERDATGIRPTRMTFAVAKRVSHAEPVDFCAPVV
jgi:hypothetical protein